MVGRTRINSWHAWLVVGLIAGIASGVEASPTLSAPASLTAIAVSATQISLSWIDLNNKGTGTIIERSLSSTSGFQEVARVRNGIASYSSTGLSASTPYYYRVRAYKQTGKSTTYSEYSNIASATTFSISIANVTTATGFVDRDSDLLTISVPAGIAAGDLLIAHISGVPQYDLIPPPGWTFVRQLWTGGFTSTTYYRFATPSEPESYTWSVGLPNAGSEGAIIAYRGVDPGYPIDTEAGWLTFPDLLGVQSTPSVTTAVSNPMIVALFGIDVASSSIDTRECNPPEGMTERYEVASEDNWEEGSDALQAAMGPTGEKIATCSVYAPGTAEIIALRPQGSPVPILDTTPPSIAITDPHDAGLIVYGPTTMTITASAFDNLGSIASVEFYDGATLKGIAFSAPYTFRWSISSSDNGTHDWTAKAYDAAGNLGVSEAVTIVVNIQ